MSNELSGLSEQDIIARCVSGIEKHDRVTIESIAAHSTTLRLSRMAMDREIGKIEISAELAKKISDAISPLAEFVKTTTPVSQHQFFSKDKDPITVGKINEAGARVIEGSGAAGHVVFSRKQVNGLLDGQFQTASADIYLSNGYADALEESLDTCFPSVIKQVSGTSTNIRAIVIDYSKHPALEEMADTCRDIIQRTGKLEIHHTPMGPKGSEGTRILGTDTQMDKASGGRLIARLRREFTTQSDAAQQDFGHMEVLYTFTPAEQSAEPA